jgi:hypothetical protein
VVVITAALTGLGFPLVFNAAKKGE